MLLALTSDVYTRSQMYDAASTILQQRLAASVGQGDDRRRAAPGVRVEINPTILNHLGVGLEDVRTALANANANRPKSNT